MTDIFRIEPSTIQFPPTYISTTNRLTIKIFNEENSVLKGEWRKYSSFDDENQYTMKLDFGDPQVRANYRQSLLFSSEVFQIDPISIEIWPNRYQQLIVNFIPKIVGEFEETAYFTITSDKNQNISKRYPLFLKGTSLPPMAQFNVSQINVGHVMLESEFEYQVILQNIGKVDINFHLDQPTSRCSSRNFSRIGSTQTENIIKFTPEQGTIIANNSIPIHIQLVANHVGQFNETYTFSIDGHETNKPQIGISGKVLGPSFKIDKHSIDFGLVSYGFLYTETFEITNESQIPFEYNLHFLADGSYEAREFNIVPATATIPKFGKQNVTVEFIPIRIQDYNVKLQFDAPKFDGLLFSMPVSAKCICPEVSIENPQIDLGHIFIGYKYETSVQLVDKTQFPAKFEFIEVSDTSTLEAEITFLKPRGIVRAKHAEVLPLTITPYQLGHLKFVRFVRIFGSDIPSIPFTITALCVGPKINLSSNEVNFGTINVLEDYKKELRVTNDSLINSHFVATFATDNKAFNVYPVESDILPGETITLTITANLNDIGTFKGRLILNFRYLTPLNIDLIARGFGSTLVPSIKMDKIDFGYAFIGQPAICQFSIENKGRKSQDIKWTIQKPKTEEKQIYTSKIEPENACIPKGEKAEFLLTVESPKPTQFMFNSICHCTVNRSRSELFHPSIEGTFIQPVVEFQHKSMKFTYVHDVLQEEKLSSNIATTLPVSPSKLLLNPIIQQNQVKNCSLLPLEIKAMCPQHFSVSPSQFILEPNSIECIEIIFDPSYKSTFTSESFDSKIKFVFNNSSSFYNLKVHTDLIFPNLQIEPSKTIDFGIVMLNAEDARPIKIKNNGPVPADFYWEMISPNDEKNETKIFDIYPIRGNLQPNESTEIHVTFFASEGKIVDNCSHFQSIAICHVIGGPEYAINLIGASAGINYSISPTSIDLGQIDYSTPIQRHATLQNQSGVPIGYKVKIPRNLEFMSLNVTPKSGTVGVNQSVSFTLNLICGYPKQLKSSILIEISQFTDAQIDITADCFYPQLKFINLDRNIDDLVLRELNNNKSNAYEIEKDLLINHCSTQKKSLTTTFSKKKLLTLNKFNGFVLSSYMVDFGQLTLGEKKSFEYSFLSSTPFPISFEILTESLKGSGFSISPTSFRDIPPNEELKITISFDSTNSKISSIGNCSYKIPITLKEDIGYMITINASIIEPTLLISQNLFEFQPTILGQTQIQTLQLQNPNNVACEFKIELPQQQINPRNAKTANSRVFTVNPSTGILPPSSFLSIDLSFTPISEKNYIMQFPVSIKYNDEKQLITLKGTGKQLRLIFEPNHIEFPAIQEFSKPSTAVVDIINMEDHPIEIYSPQFDFQLFLNTLKGFKSNEDNRIEDNSRETVSFLSKRPNYTSHQKRDNIYSRISKYSVCVIVHGPPKSGRTTISKEISKYLENIPIINLSHVWSSLPIETSQADDYIKAIQELISQNEYQKGFIIDGLDSFQEASDGESFLVHFLKQKNTQDDLQKNPFTVLTHTNSTACETALNYLLSALDGHAVYLVALNANEQILANHQSNNDNEEIQKKQKENQEMMDKVFNMSEEEYQSLTDQEKEEVDQKREYFRTYLMNRTDELSDFSFEQDSPSTKKNDKNKKSRPKGPLPTDPFLLSVMMFQFTFGRIAERTRQGGNFYVFDYQTDKQNEAPQEKPKTAIESAKQTASGSRAKKKDKGDTSNDNVENVTYENENSMSQCNCLLVEASLALNDVCKEIFTYLPDLPKLRIKLSKYLIPQIQILSPDESIIGCPTLQNRPDYFKIENEDVPGSIPEELYQCIEPYIKSQKSKIPIYYIDNYEPSANIKPMRSRVSMDNLNFASVRKSVSHISISTEFKSDEIENKEEYYLQQIELLEYTKHWTIEAHSRITLNLEFNALTIGNYKSNLLFSICHCKNDIFKLPVCGSVICPDIDRNPRYIFPICKEKCDSKALNTFDLSKNQFNFGSLMISKEKPTKTSIPLYRQDLKIKNITDVPLTVSGMFLENSHKLVWSIENQTMILNPEQQGIFRIGFTPIANEKYRNVFSIYVKDNPEPFSFVLCGEGCSPTIDISTTNIDFEKIMLSQQRTIKIDLKNTGKIGAYWKIKGGSTIGNCVTLSSTEGLLMPSKSSSIDFTFSSSKPVVLKKVTPIEIFDETKTKLFSSHNLTFVGEAFDVAFDLTFPKNMNHLQFGFIKVSQQKQLSCMIHNKGKYPAKYVFKITKNSLKNLIKIDSPEGIIQAGEKPLAINFTILSNQALKLVNSKGLTFVVLDSNSGEEKETAVIPIPVSVEVVYSSFVIEPLNIINFGSSALNTNNIKEVKITNNGRFAFDFEILPKIEVTPPDLALHDRRPMKTNARVTKNASAMQRKASKRSTGKEFTVGHFTVQTSMGTISPNSSTIIPIIFNSNIDGDFKNSILIKISDSKEEENEGTQIDLTATCIAASIETDNIEKILSGYPLCIRYDIEKVDCNAFLEDDHVFHFASQLLNTKSSIDVWLINPFPIECQVDVTLKPIDQSALHSPFDISDKTVIVEANSKKSVTIGFKPTTCNQYSANFEASIHNQTTQLNTKPKSIKFGIEGSGTLPMISLLPATEMTSTRSTIINFGKTLVGLKKEKVINVQNIGVIPANIVLKTTQNVDDFQIILLTNATNKSKINLPKSNTNDPSPPSKNRAPPNKSGQFNTELSNILLGSNATQSIKIIYSPTAIKKGQFHVLLSVQDNNAADISLTLIGEGFSEDVIFEGVSDDHNVVEFKNCVVGRRQQATFMMHNVSSNNVRFAWYNSNDFTFSPRVGHLKKHSRKEITASFISEKPLTYTNYKAACSWAKIEFKEQDPPDWDDSMQQVSFVQRSVLLQNPNENENNESNENETDENTETTTINKAKTSPKTTQKAETKKNGARKNTIIPLKQEDLTETSVVFVSAKGPDYDLIKVVEIKPEPLFEVIPGKLKDLSIQINAVSDFIRYSIDTTEIEFAPTMMYETRISTVTMTNTCNIRFDYSWNTSVFGSLRTDYAQTMKSPFSVEPNSGFIEPGETQTFNVMFSPIEVDDFNSHLTCDIKHLVKQQPPEIYVTGRSRRPLCHFNLITSDYLSAGRRHPDYTSSLPENVKVIELFSKGIGQRVNKKFEIINTTEEPYEINWTQSALYDEYNDDSSLIPDKSIVCEIQHAMISSGKRHTAIFSYTPTTLKTIESLWEFKIPEYGVSIPLLVVGKIIPHK